MKKEIKAALLSAFVCPGVGQMYLRRYLRGVMMLIVVVGALGFMVANATMRALDGLEKIQRAGALDANALASLAAASSVSGSTSYDSWILLMIAAFWLFSVIDAYRMGKNGVSRR